MRQQIVLKHEFVEFIPKELAEGTVYVSIPFATAVHKCCCGCGMEVVTPLSPTDWQLTFDGKSISLDPSIGNWSFRCRSHYFIIRNRVLWALPWSQERIRAGRASDTSAKERYYDSDKPKPAPLDPIPLDPALHQSLPKASIPPTMTPSAAKSDADSSQARLWSRVKRKLKKWLFGS